MLGDQLSEKAKTFKCGQKLVNGSYIIMNPLLKCGGHCLLYNLQQHILPGHTPTIETSTCS